MKFQDWKFENRSRNENPENFRKNVLSDVYLSWVYTEIYRNMMLLLDISKVANPKILEIGSAGGITDLLNPSVVTSDVRQSPGVLKIIDATKMTDVTDGSLDGILAKDVLHHLPNPEAHFSEVLRVLKVGGSIIYAEPNWNVLSRFVFSLFHPEPFQKGQKHWKFESLDPMYSNQALSWIIFERDLVKFTREFPAFEVSKLKQPINGVAFLLSGGVNRRTPISGKLLKRLGMMEMKHEFLMRQTGLLRFIKMTKSYG